MIAARNEHEHQPAMTFPREQLSPLSLGTVQLGMAYGIANPAESITAAQADAVLDAAWDGGVRCLDTARAYGVAEGRIGVWRAARGSAPLLVSKFPNLEGEDDPAAAVERHFAASCAALGVERLDGYLAHRAIDIGRPGVADTLRTLCDAGRLAAFGVSVYDTDELDRALGVPGLGAIQVPVSVFNTGLIRSGALARCRAAGVVAFARGAFLQGALFMAPDGLPDHLAPVAPVLHRLAELAAVHGLGLEALALGFLRAQVGIDSIVVGALTASQLSASIVAMAAPPLDEGLVASLSSLGAALPAAAVDPRFWPT
jgi:aryl-alcohol dehydrogenase-like predicted oxidoreductase